MPESMGYDRNKKAREDAVDTAFADLFPETYVADRQETDRQDKGKKTVAEDAEAEAERAEAAEPEKGDKSFDDMLKPDQQEIYWKVVGQLRKQGMSWPDASQAAREQLGVQQE
ncbi:hypothetical protein CMI37_21445 [Candidatus Pacearchaeota archaeon]|nr:hypothetical protein [Candidatus Pacearchaeota archaeon]|tara:strand:- start:2094 stop:2432 length:339 start_codon:yes stop_codon:yes gene_type:complete